MMINLRRLHLALVLGLCTLLCACGFQLRGADGSLRMPFQSLYLAVDARSPLGAELTRHLRAMSGGKDGTQLVAVREQAEVVLEILGETRDKTILSLNSAGRVREYSLQQTTRLRVVNKHGKELLLPTDIVLKRSIAFNESQVLAKEAEEALLFRDMQSDLVQQIMRRLAALQVD